MLRKMDILNITGMALGRATFKTAMVLKTGKRKTPTGFVLYNGPSQLDPTVNIVVIVTGLSKPSSNNKTGDMLQFWILREDISPKEAVDIAGDYAICGDCPHRRSQGGACYVKPWEAPLSIWKAYKRGNYPEISPKDAAVLLAGMWGRFGAYGDPSAAPIQVWEPVSLTLRKHSGYTRQWRNLDVNRWGFLMASTMTEAETTEAQAMGWRTFRIRLEGADTLDNEIDCPSAKDNSAMPITCAACNLCAGQKPGKRVGKSITVEVHGINAYIQKFEKQVREAA